MRGSRWLWLGVALLCAGIAAVGCAATLKNFDQISLGMTPEEVLKIAGKPHRVLLIESTGQGTLVPTPAGKHELWIYRGGAIQFTEGKVVAKGQRTTP